MENLTISQLTENEVHPESQKVLDSMKEFFGRPVPGAMILAHSPETLSSFFGLTKAAMKVLTPRIKESISVYTAVQNGCTFCESAHTGMARKAGFTNEEIDQIKKGDDTSLDTSEAAAFRISKSILHGKGRLSDDQITEAKALGLSDQEIIEVFLITIHSILNNYFNRLINRENPS